LRIVFQACGEAGDHRIDLLRRNAVLIVALLRQERGRGAERQIQQQRQDRHREAQRERRREGATGGRRGRGRGRFGIGHFFKEPLAELAARLFVLMLVERSGAPVLVQFRELVAVHRKIQLGARAAGRGLGAACQQGQ